jgi:hypothetical protein
MSAAAVGHEALADFWFWEKFLCFIKQEWLGNGASAMGCSPHFGFCSRPPFGLLVRIHHLPPFSEKNSRELFIAGVCVFLRGKLN